MSRAAVEFDFFGMERQNSSKPQPRKLFERRRSFQNLQSAISKINPEVLKTVISSGSVTPMSDGKPSENGRLVASRNSFSVPCTPKPDQSLNSASPLRSPLFRPSHGSPPQSAPMTIFYNGDVSVFNVSPHKAEYIVKLAVGETSKIAQPPERKASSRSQRQLLKIFEQDMPITRRKSIERFLEKRKGRVAPISPYYRGRGFVLWDY